MLSSALFPGTSEVLIYPAPRRVVGLPAPEVLPFMMRELDEQAGQPCSDYEIVTGLGQLARYLKPQRTEAVLETWLQTHPTQNGFETAALFLSGFWSSQTPPSASLVEQLTTSSRQHPQSVGSVETLIQALGSAAAYEDAGIRERIRAVLLPLVPLYPLLQDSSQRLFRHASGLGEHQLPKPRPAPGDFKAYAYTADGGEHLSIEHVESQRETVRIKSLTVSERILSVDYQIRIITCTDVLARELIAQTVLLELCEDVYRPLADQVRYTNPSRRSSTIVSYPAPPIRRSR